MQFPWINDLTLVKFSAKEKHHVLIKESFDKKRKKKEYNTKKFFKNIRYT